MTENAGRGDGSPDDPNYEFRCHENVNLDHLDPEVRAALLPVNAKFASYQSDSFPDIPPEPETAPASSEIALLRQFGFLNVARSLETLELQLWVFSSPPLVLSLEYRWANEETFRRCPFEERNREFGTEIVVPTDVALPFQSRQIENRVVFRIKISKLQTSSIDFTMYEHVDWYEDHAQLLLYRDIPCVPDQSWRVASDLLEENGHPERADQIRAFCANYFRS